MRLTRAMVLCAVLAMPISAAMAAPPTNEQVEKAIQTFREVSQGKPPAEVRAAAEQALKGIAPDELTLEQVEKLMASGPGLIGMQRDDFKRALVARLNDLAKDTGADGAAAAALAVDVSPRGEQSAAIIASSKHPGLAAAFAKGRGTGLLGWAGMVDPKPLAEAGVFTRLSSLVTKDFPTARASDAARFVDGAMEEAAGLPKAERERLRRTVVEIVDTALRDASPSDAAAQRRIASLERLRARLNGAAMRGELIGHEAPPIEFTWSSIEPAPKSFADFKGKIVVVDFWATWCGPCIAAFPKLAEKVERYQGLPVVVLGVTSIQGSHTNLRATDPKERRIDTRDDPAREMALMTPYIKEMGITWPVVFSRQDVFNPDFGVTGIPHVAIIDASGKVRYNGLHPMNPEVEKRIDELLAEMGHTAPPKKAASARPGN